MCIYDFKSLNYKNYISLMYKGLYNFELSIVIKIMIIHYFLETISRISIKLYI